MSVLAKIRAAFLVVFLLAAGLSTYVYLNGRALMQLSEPLLSKQLPTLQVIARLQLEVASLEPLLYQYYATVDRDAYLEQYESLQSDIQEDMDTLSENLAGASRLLAISTHLKGLTGLAERLDSTLGVYGSGEVDWDDARERLVEVSAAGHHINERLDLVASSVHEEVNIQAGQTGTLIYWVVTAVLVFSGLIALMAAFLGSYVVGLARRSAAEAAKAAQAAEEAKAAKLAETVKAAEAVKSVKAAEAAQVAEVARAIQNSLKAT